MGIQHVLTGIKSGVKAAGLDRHWKPIQEQSQGHTWRKVAIPTEGKAEIFLQEESSGDFYAWDTQDWAFAKNIGAIAVAKYVYGAAFVYHIGVGLSKAAKRLPEAWQNFQTLKHERDFSLPTFVKSNLQEFYSIGKTHFEQAVTDFLIAGPLWIDPILFGVGGLGYGTISIALGVYSLYNPLQFRVFLHRIEEWWRPANVDPLPEENIQKLTPWQTARAAVEGSLPLSRIWKMHFVMSQEDMEKSLKAPNKEEKHEKSRYRVIDFTDKKKT